jgi:Holliday junction DNA helicase RuvA
MIGYLKGNIVAQHNREVWVNVLGVGYRVRVNHKLQMTNDKSVELFIHTAVKEDSITLYGFKTMDELQLFELLISVSGIGPKTGMEIVSAADSNQIEAAISQADVNFFSKIKGIGKKSAQRIIIDLKSKIGSLKEMDLSEEDEDDSVYQALKQFGFKPGEIQAALKHIDRATTEQAQIKEGLKLLGKTRVLSSPK